MEGYSVEWVGVIVAVVAQMALGFWWYSPIGFGNRWRTEMGAAGDAGPSPSAKPFIVVILGALVTAVFLAAVLDWAGAGSATDGLVLGLYLGIVSALAVAGGHFFEQRSNALTLIDSGSELVRMTLVGLVLGFWI